VRVLILTQSVPDDAPPEEQDVRVQAESVRESLEGLGHRVHQAAVDLNLTQLLEILEDPPDVVFNLVESLGGHDDLQSLAAYVLELRRVPYTGCPAGPLGETNDKPGIKARLASLGLPTPAWVTWGRGVEGGSLVLHGASAFPRGRYIIKPSRRHASYGIDDDAVIDGVSHPAHLVDPIRSRERATGVECFAERFVEGREVNLPMLATANGPRVLAFAEIDFADFPPEKPHIVGYAAKWEDRSFEYHHTPRRFWAPEEEHHLRRLLSRLVHCAWAELHLDGAVRFDLRIDPEGQPWILEVNANPCLSPDAGFMAAAAQAGLRPMDVHRRLVERALGRGVGPWGGGL
jgi:D-alanine-D-alanine ligase